MFENIEIIEILKELNLKTNTLDIDFEVTPKIINEGINLLQQNSEDKPQKMDIQLVSKKIIIEFPDIDIPFTNQIISIVIKDIQFELRYPALWVKSKTAYLNTNPIINNIISSKIKEAIKKLQLDTLDSIEYKNNEFQMVLYDIRKYNKDISYMDGLLNNTTLTITDIIKDKILLNIKKV